MIVNRSASGKPVAQEIGEVVALADSGRFGRLSGPPSLEGPRSTATSTGRRLSFKSMTSGKALTVSVQIEGAKRTHPS